MANRYTIVLIFAGYVISTIWVWLPIRRILAENGKEVSPWWSRIAAHSDYDACRKLFFKKTKPPELKRFKRMMLVQALTLLVLAIVFYGWLVLREI